MQILYDDCFIGERQDENLLPAHPESALLTMEKNEEEMESAIQEDEEREEEPCR